MVLVPNFVTIPLFGAVLGYFSCNSPYTDMFSKPKGAIAIVSGATGQSSTIGTTVFQVGVGALAGLAFYIATSD
jgi:hypothetical protein